MLLPLRGSDWTRAYNAVPSRQTPWHHDANADSHSLAAKTVWTEGRPDLSAYAPPRSDVADGDVEAFEDCEPPPEPHPRSRVFRTAHSHDIRCRGFFQCDLCPYRKVEPDARKLSNIRTHHLKCHHGGQGACGAALGKSVADVHRRILQAWQLGTQCSARS